MKAFKNTVLALIVLLPVITNGEHANTARPQAKRLENKQSDVMEYCKDHWNSNGLNLYRATRVYLSKKKDGIRLRFTEYSTQPGIKERDDLFMAFPEKESFFDFPKGDEKTRGPLTFWESTIPRGKIAPREEKGEAKALVITMKGAPPRHIYVIRSASSNQNFNFQESKTHVYHRVVIFDDQGNFVKLQTETPLQGKNDSPNYRIITICGPDTFGFNRAFNARFGKLTDPILDLSPPGHTKDGRQPDIKDIRRYSDRLQAQIAAIRNGTYRQAPLWLMREEITRILRKKD